MNIEKKVDGSSLAIAVEGRLDTLTAPELEAELKASLDGITSLDIDLSKLDYISSTGLRVLVGAHKAMARQGKLAIRGANELVMEVFEVTGLADILPLV